MIKNHNQVYREKCVLNPQIFEKKKKYVWFTRNEDFREDILGIFKLFLFHGIYIEGFASDNFNDVGLKIFNKLIVDIDTLDEVDAIVFTNLKVKHSICRPTRVYTDKKEMGMTAVPYTGDVEGFQLKEGTFLRVYRIVEMKRLLQDKRIFVYGIGNEAKKFAKYLRLLDFKFAGFLADFKDIAEEKMDGYAVACVEDVLYEDNGFVIIAGGNVKKSIKKMEELGFQYSIDYVLAEPFAAHYLFVRQNALDINLGNTFTGKSKYDGMHITERNIISRYPGFCIYGTIHKDNYKIVVLGGSTTDGNLFWFKSWPEILFEQLNKKNITIYNGGVSGYTSGQELLKFIRDVLPLKPDMVIVFDGYNDTCQGCSRHPYSFSYAKEIYDYGARNIADEYVQQQISSLLCEGISVEGSCFDNWINNMELFYDISVARNIKFYSFLQPMIMSKVRTGSEDEIYMSSRQFYEKDLYCQKSFRNEIDKSEIKGSHEYIYDLSDIFDELPDVYVDVCHVNEKGNKVIADSIYGVIKNQIVC